MTGDTAAAVGLSLVSAVAYATAAVAQERLAAEGRGGGRLLALLGRTAWWWAVGLNIAGALLHVAALAFGPLTLVQPLGALTLVAAVPLGAYRAGRKVTRAEWSGTVYTLVGLAFILLAASGAAPDEALGLSGTLGVSGAAVALCALLCVSLPGAAPGLRHATASGISSGVASALVQTLTVAFAGRGVSLPAWQLGLVGLFVAVFAVGGLLFAQVSYRGGLGAPLALLTLANPVAAAAIGIILLGERLQGGVLGIAAALVGAVAAARGVVLLTRAAVAQTGRSSNDTPAARGGGTRLEAVPEQESRRSPERA